MRAIIEQFLFKEHVFYASQINGEVFAHLIRNGIELICFSRTGPIDSSLDALFRDFSDPNIYLGPKALAHFTETMPEDLARIEELSETELYPIMRMSAKGLIEVRMARKSEVTPVIDRANGLIRYYEKKIEEAIENFDRSMVELSEEPEPSRDPVHEACPDDFARRAAEDEVERLMARIDEGKQTAVLEALVDDDLVVPADNALDLDLSGLIPDLDNEVDTEGEVSSEKTDDFCSDHDDQEISDLYDIRFAVCGEISGARLETITPIMETGSMTLCATGNVTLGEISWRTEILYRGLTARIAASLLREMTEMIPAYPSGTSIVMESSGRLC